MRYLFKSFLTTISSSVNISVMVGIRWTAVCDALYLSVNHAFFASRTRIIFDVIAISFRFDIRVIFTEI